MEPPKYSSCAVCGESFFKKNRRENWNEFLIHGFKHYFTSGSAWKLPPDDNLLEYLLEKRAITGDVFELAMKRAIVHTGEYWDNRRAISRALRRSKKIAILKKHRTHGTYGIVHSPPKAPLVVSSSNNATTSLLPDSYLSARSIWEIQKEKDAEAIAEKIKKEDEELADPQSPTKISPKDAYIKYAESEDNNANIPFEISKKKFTMGQSAQRKRRWTTQYMSTTMFSNQCLRSLT